MTEQGSDAFSGAILDGRGSPEVLQSRPLFRGLTLQNLLRAQLQVSREPHKGHRVQVLTFPPRDGKGGDFGKPGFPQALRGSLHH